MLIGQKFIKVNPKKICKASYEWTKSLKLKEVGTHDLFYFVIQQKSTCNTIMKEAVYRPNFQFSWLLMNLYSLDPTSKLPASIKCISKSSAETKANKTGQVFILSLGTIITTGVPPYSFHLLLYQMAFVLLRKGFYD